MTSTTVHRLVIPSPQLLRFLRSQADSTSLSSVLLGSPNCTSHISRRGRRFVSFRTPSREIKLLPAPRCGPFQTARSNYEPEMHFQPPTLRTPSSPRRRRSSFGDSKKPLLRRLFSSTKSSNFWGIFGLSKNSPPHSHHRGDLPPLASFLEDTQFPGRILNATNEPRLRCTEFDENGNVTLVNGEFKKSELIAKYGLLPRDLRKIDSSLLPHILIRPGAILVNLLHLRVLIKHNRVLVFDAYGSTDSYTQSVFMYDLEGKLRQLDAKSNGSLPYEFRALEAVLISVTTGLEGEFEGVRDPVVRVLRELEEDIDRDKLRYLLIYSKKLGTFEQKARLVRDALDELLEADDDLAAMYLTEKAVGKGRSEQDHAEVELLLESYHKVTDEIVQAAENLVSNIRNTEEIVRAILDANRNSLMLLELRFSICTLGLGAGTFIAALYGMNLKNFIEESDLGFWGVSGISAALSVFAIMYGLGRLRKVQKINMWGECPPDRNRWANMGWWARRRSAKERYKELKAAAKEEEKLAALGGGGSGLWGLGKGTATGGLGALGGPAEIRAERLRKLGEKAAPKENWHVARRRGQSESAKTASEDASGAGPAPGFD